MNKINNNPYEEFNVRNRYPKRLGKGRTYV